MLKKKWLLFVCFLNFFQIVQMAVHIVQQAEKHNENVALGDSTNKVWLNPSRCLVDRALERWSTTKMRADNTSVVTLMLDPPGPPKAQVLKNQRKTNNTTTTTTTYADSGLEIMTRYEEQQHEESDKKPQFVPKPRESTAFHPNEPEPNIQINEISSSSSNYDEKSTNTTVELDEKPTATTKMNLRSTSDDLKVTKKRDCVVEAAAAAAATDAAVTKKRKCERKIVERKMSVKKKYAIRRAMAPKITAAVAQPISSEAVSSSNNHSTKENIKPERRVRLERKRLKIVEDVNKNNNRTTTTKGL